MVVHSKNSCLRCSRCKGFAGVARICIRTGGLTVNCCSWCGWPLKTCSRGTCNGMGVMTFDLLMLGA